VAAAAPLPNTGESDRPYLAVVSPVFNDWGCVPELLARLDQALGSIQATAEVYLVDDASTLARSLNLAGQSYQAIRSVWAVRLKRNLGHQRAIAVGLGLVSPSDAYDAVLVLDSDGEDRPEDVPQLYAAMRRTNGSAVVFAERTRRTEGWWFKLMYWLYRVSHRWLTGIAVRFGNFSLVPIRLCRSLTLVSDLWNHYAAAVVKSRLPYTSVPCPRGARIAGTSQMNLVSLTSHGLRAFSVFSEEIGTRALLLCLALFALSLLGSIIVVAIRFGTSYAIPGWATTAMAFAILVALQSLTLAAVFTFFVLSSRSFSATVPLREAELFIESKEMLYGPGATR
jgi:glycosyltransferase involved in cell wall biosynthesis